MAHFAQIENGVVTRVIVVDNYVVAKDSFKVANPDLCADLRNISGRSIKVSAVDVEWEDATKGITLCKKLFGADTEWVQTSYNGNIRKRYAGIGYTYDKDNDVFVQPQPFPSWKLNENFEWQAPVPMPDDGKEYTWDEKEQKWNDTKISGN